MLDALQLERLRRLAVAAGPADPGALVLGEHRVQGGDQTARAGAPLPLAVVGGDLVDGQAVGDDDEGTSFGHAECTSGSFLFPPTSLLCVAASRRAPSGRRVPSWAGGPVRRSSPAAAAAVLPCGHRHGLAQRHRHVRRPGPRLRARPRPRAAQRQLTPPIRSTPATSVSHRAGADRLPAGDPGGAPVGRRRRHPARVLLLQTKTSVVYICRGRGGLAATTTPTTAETSWIENADRAVPARRGPARRRRLRGDRGRRHDLLGDHRAAAASCTRTDRQEIQPAVRLGNRQGSPGLYQTAPWEDWAYPHRNQRSRR